ncbi:unnamed protein product [Effrenium voratum]|nr:unnamed protein product [Effrenium voratum]|mmetsp:Transcript_94441/g.224997  ORF Transcript_94441/g.224997 Transcript_94441/m.224997 type:complete len:359 (-) Transcript_94441:78-1154(-)
MRRLAFIIGSVAADTSCAAVGSGLLQKAASSVQLRADPTNYGAAGCKCIGLDGVLGSVELPERLGGQTTTKRFNSSVGAHCDAWTCTKEEACEPWCFVDPCSCNVTMKETLATEQLTWQGHAVFASKETCKAKPKKPLPGSERPKFCDATADEDKFGDQHCKCIGVAGLQGNVSVEVAGRMAAYPMDLGSSCQSWDAEKGACRGKDRPAWCDKRWCYVDPCACALVEPPKVSAFFPGATYGEKPLYYSYETCGSFDTFTMDSRSACVNQESEAECLALGADPEEPELRKCAWGGPEIKCLGKELLHVCQVSDKTLTDWSWWSFNHGDLEREQVFASMTTGCIYGCILCVFVCVLRGLL